MTIEINKNLQDHGVSEIKYYYKNLPLVGNIFTACVLLSKNRKILARGVSICSLSDIHNKKEGRKNALKRATKAFFKKENSEAINSNLIENGRYYLDVKKFFKVRNEEQEKVLLSNLNLLNLFYEEKNINGIKHFSVTVPYMFPIEITEESFIFKSEYEPNPTTEEIKILKLQ